MTRTITAQHQPWIRPLRESTRGMERRRAVVGRRLSQRLARLSLPLRRGQGRDPR
jgi:hypothetical protein